MINKKTNTLWKAENKRKEGSHCHKKNRNNGVLATTTETAAKTSKKQNNNFARASSFFVHFSTALQDYNVKMPYFTFYGGLKQATTNFFSLSLNFSAVTKKSTPGKSAHF